APTVSFSDVLGSFAGIGNLNADPRFVRNPGSNRPADLGDLHLQTDSPCINQGSALAMSLPAPHLDRTPRILGGGPDMGAYEAWVPGCGAWFVDGMLGNDMNPGTPEAPFQTVTRALNLATDGNGIYVRAGNYDGDRPRITKSLRLVNWGQAGLA